MFITRGTGQRSGEETIKKVLSSNKKTNHSILLPRYNITPYFSYKKKKENFTEIKTFSIFRHRVSGIQPENRHRFFVHFFYRFLIDI